MEINTSMKESTRLTDEVRLLNQVKPGEAVILGNYDALPVSFKNQLQAFMLAPGQVITVIQQMPVTIIRFAHTELALEHEIARKIEIRTELR